MNRTHRTLLWLVCSLAAGMAWLVVIRVGQRAHPPPPDPVVMHVSSDLVIGSRLPKRPLSPSRPILVEFGNYQCRYCFKAQAYLERLSRREPTITLVFRHVTDGLSSPVRAAELTECARVQGKFWPMHRALFERHGRVTEAERNPLAGTVGLDIGKMDRDRSTNVRLLLGEDHRAAIALHIHFTPAFYLCLDDDRVIWLATPQQVERFLGVGKA